MIDYNKYPKEAKRFDYFEGDNPFGIADLRLDRQADDAPEPVVRWASIPKGWRIRGGTWHFYVHDALFKNMALCCEKSIRCDRACPNYFTKYPNAVFASAASVCVEASFLVGPLSITPKWKAIAAIAKKRWLARYWQEQGIRIIADLNVHSDHFSLAFIGIPYGWSSYAVRANVDMPIERMDEIHEQCKEHAGSDDLLFCVFGGTRKDHRRHCEIRGWRWFKSDRPTKAQKKALCPI